MHLTKIKKLFLPAIILVALLVITFFAWAYVRNSVYSYTNIRFEEQVNDYVMGIQSGFGFYTDMLYEAQGFFEANPNIDASKFSTYFSKILQQSKHPEILAIAFVERVENKDKDSFVKEVRSDTGLDPKGFPDFKISPPGDRPEYFVVRWRESRTVNQPVLGLDIYTIPDRQQAMGVARDSGKPAITPKIELVGAYAGVQGFVIFNPIYKAGLPLNNTEDRRRALIGFIDVALRTQEFFSEISSLNPGIDMEVFDGTNITKENLIYDSNKVFQSGDPSVKAAFVTSRNIEIGGRTWTFNFLAMNASGLSIVSFFTQYAPIFTLIIGFSLSFLLVLIIYVLSTARERALFVAEEATKELKSANEALRKRAEELSQKNKTVSEQMQELEAAKYKSEEEAQNTKKFQEAVEGAAEHIIITDIDGTILYANKAAERITGYSRAEMIGKRPSLWGNRMGKEFYAKMWKTIKDDKKTFHGEINNRRKNGEDYVADVYVTPILDNSGNVKSFVGVERDITKEKAVDRAKTEFVSLASHQLRTPLSAIKWIIELLMEEKSRLTEKQRERLQDIYVSNERVINLVNDLLNVSRMEAGAIETNLQAIDVCQLINMLMAVPMGRIESKKLKIRVSCSSDIGKAQLDPMLFNQAFQNVVDNAINYATEESVIDIAVKKDDGNCLVTIHNEGSFIPESDREKIFTKFYRGSVAQRAKPEGSGLGLFIAKSVTEAQGGKIWFESSKEGGVTFFFRFPYGGK